MADQCNSKIRKLKLEYRKIKDSRNKTGTGRKEWKFFDAMDAVLGHKPAIEPPEHKRAHGAQYTPLIAGL